MFNALAKKKTTAKPDAGIVQSMYNAVMAMSREPVFYTRFAVPDTTDGRFDLMCLMLSLYLFRIQQADPEMAQAVFDFTFKDVDRGLREAGVGDLGVPKHMKRMISGFYGRAAAYYEALEQGQNEGLAVILTRNLYNGDMNAPVAAMAEWVNIAWQFMRQIDFAELVSSPDILNQLVPPDTQE